ncbi:MULTISPECIES: hypothetical protein [unclassified Nocardiopsis]|uniref:hypothetical protein n=1 Tax=unclassified Nocardiopsis TaxID=2649073 RepID=UPI001916354A|nr:MULTISPECIES: hypothetical protein [unclassified Nocardiopsis]
MPTPRSGGASGGETARTYVGWRHTVLLPPPGPAPRRPTPSDAETLGEEWIAAEREREAQTNRPLYFALAGLALFALLFPLLWTLRILPGSFAVGGVFACAAIAAPIAFALVQSRQVVAERLARARERLSAEREERDRALREQQREHARRYTEWQAAARAYEAQPLWYGVTSGAGTVLVVGGDEAGWSALLTTVGVSRLREGGDLTVVDLTGRSVVRELVNLARRCAVAPRRWVLPADLPRMSLGTNLDAGQRARILSAVAAASGATDDADADETLLLRLLEVLGQRAGIAELIGGLRALLTPADDAAEDDPALALLTPDQRVRVRERCAGGADVRKRAWELERRLSPFEAVGTRADDAGYAQIKIISIDRASGRDAARLYGTYAVSALSELLEAPEPPRGVDGRRPRVRPDRTRTVVVCGAETLPAGEVDQVLAAAAEGGVEVVLMFRTAAPAALSRFPDPSCLPVVMRQDEGAEAVARAVARMPGAADRDQDALRLHRLTEGVGEAVADAVPADEGDPDAEVASDDRFFPSPHTDSGAVIRNAAAAIAPLDLVRHVRSATAWGRATARADGADVPASATGGEEPPVRTCGLDAESLRALPSTAALVLTPDGPVLADTNPGILTLSTATLATVDDSRNTGTKPDVGHENASSGDGTGSGRRAGSPRAAAPDSSDPAGLASAPAETDGRVPPNLGPPPERLDWRV